MYCVPLNLAPAPYFLGILKSNVPTVLGDTGNVLGVDVSGTMVSDDEVLVLVAVDDAVISNPVDDVNVLNLIGLESITLSFRESASGSANARGVIKACNLLIVSLLLCPLLTKVDTSLIFYIHPMINLSFELPMMRNLLVGQFLLCLH